MRALLLSHIYYYGLLHARAHPPLTLEINLLVSTTEIKMIKFKECSSKRALLTDE
jgi:hypothetical protein